MFRLLCLTTLFAVALAGEMQFRDCSGTGLNNILRVEISNCEGAHCVFHKGHTSRFTAEFTAAQNSEKLEFKIIAKPKSSPDFRVPFVDPDGCHDVQCPLATGQNYTFSYDFKVPKQHPTVKADLELHLTGANGVAACFSFSGEVVE